MNSNDQMKTINEIRVDNAKKLRDSLGGNSSFAIYIDREATQVSRIIGKNPTKKIGDDLARHIEKCFQLTTGWLDQDHGDKTQIVKSEVLTVERNIQFVPIISWVQAGTWTESTSTNLNMNDYEYLPCPVTCSKMTYILRVVGESMYPEYLPGDMIFIDPEICPQDGDDVVALLEGTGGTTFKRYINDGTTKALKAINPNWPASYLEINGNCTVLGTVVFSGKKRK